jgi:ribose-phosphate pyrophosphokinase
MQSVNDTLMELFLLVRTMKRASARSITVVIPYYGYARQDRKAMSRVPISAADVAMMLEEGGADRVLTIDLHCGQIQGFFRNVPVDNLFSSPIFIDYFVSKELNNVVVVSPDAGGVDRAYKFAQQLRQKGVPAEMALISKRRASAGVIESMYLIGDVYGADAIIVDDICDTAGTLVKAAQLLKDSGASRVFAVIPHAVFSGNALDKIRNSVIYEMVIADTIPLREQAPDNLTCLTVSSLLGDAILRIYKGESVSALFD